MRGNYDQAYAHYRESQRLAGKEGLLDAWSTATYSIGKYYARTMQLGEAASTLDSVIELGPNMGLLHPSGRSEQAGKDQCRNVSRQSYRGDTGL